MTARTAVIDIGTNSTRLLVADVDAAGRLAVVKTALATTRLGEGMAGGALTPAGMRRTVEAIGTFRAAAEALEAGKVVAVATSAVREAANRAVFLRLARESCGLEVRVLSGEEEAILSRQGALAGLPVDPERALVIDIGGGSTEFCWQEEGRLGWASLPLGAVRLTEVEIDDAALAEALEPVLGELRRRPRDPVGVGGTITTLAAMAQRLEVYDPARVHGYVLALDEVDRLLALLLASTLEERRRLPGLQPERADIIPAGARILRAVLHGLGAQSIRVSEYDLLHGIALEASRAP
ncbi:MAG: Ppx/GppA phosphatase family protein [Bacillota bacterium]